MKLVFGRKLQDRGYSHPIHVFLSNFTGFFGEEIFNQVESVEILSILQVLPPPSYSNCGHFTFIILPDAIYNHIPIALKNGAWESSPINFHEDITVTGVFVNP